MGDIETTGLCKSYGPRAVLHGVDLGVPSGALFGFLGPNGAGKTTTIRILMGLLKASAGRAAVLGRDPWREGPTLRQEVGYLPGDVRWYDRLTGAQTLAFFDRARGTRSADEIGRLAEVLDLDLTRRVRLYSRGMKQKLGLIQALMHRPRLLILDEPTAALDPLIQVTVHDELRRVAAEGRTVLFSSHSLGEVQQLCDWVAILRDGRLIEQTTIDHLRERAMRRVVVVFDPSAPAPPESPPRLHVSHRDDHSLTGAWVGDVAPLLRWLGQHQVRDLTIEAPDLDDLFMAYYAGEGRREK